MRQATHILTIGTEHRGLIEITDAVRAWMADQSVRTGLLTPHSREIALHLLAG